MSWRLRTPLSLVWPYWDSRIVLTEPPATGVIYSTWYSSPCLIPLSLTNLKTILNSTEPMKTVSWTHPSTFIREPQVFSWQPSTSTAKYSMTWHPLSPRLPSYANRFRSYLLSPRDGPSARDRDSENPSRRISRTRASEGGGGGGRVWDGPRVPRTLVGNGESRYVRPHRTPTLRCPGVPCSPAFRFPAFPHVSPYSFLGTLTPLKKKIEIKNKGR